ncbi:Alpha/Beta hydrolase protein [Fimicolochytrium jonesii]|uniref:Alpha/Beta hydrolase protein n=1 Tax=Fimicolochytrium jonesii TaxID=1396493 RepID=UPI0022FF2259|nr:Alpha/Beta hydrolase protein [Fimicolochytrium jonesii]KAI8822874.1 Alpha/Beta hydrolase protein [Fimicolochytrium jonesii]
MLSSIPVIGRLRIADYLRLCIAVCVLVFEPILRFIFGIFWPLRYIVDGIRKVFPSTLLTGKPHDEGVNGVDGVNGDGPEGIQQAEKILEGFSSSEEFVRFWGFPFQHHYVTTKDGYILALHRIPYSRAEHETKKKQKAANRRLGLRSTGSHPEGNRPVVLLWHGFLMCSEVWICTPDPKLSLAFTLAEAGYDVWMGNTRGNKYSCKHRYLKPTEEAFWDFSMDHLALYDLPDAVDYILKVTGVPSLSYVGFSQGSGQGFSSLSINPRLNKRVNLFVALAPAAKPMGLENKTLGTMLKISPEVVFLLFGRKSLLSVTPFWQSILSPLSFAWTIDIACNFLFRWKAEMIDHKNVVYQHLYSYTSVKCVVHWFQIIRNGRFQMYDESPTMLPNSQSGHVVPKFPTEHIQTPIALFYGGKDTLADMTWLLQETATPVYCLKVDEYEHICFLWARGLDKTVYPAILGLLHEYAETWGDPSSTTVSVEPTKVATVPWISENQIRSLLEIGQGHMDETGQKIVLDGRISAQRMLVAASRPVTRMGTLQDGLGLDATPSNVVEQEEEARAIQTALLMALKNDKSQTNLAPLVTDSGKGGGRHPVTRRRTSAAITVNTASTSIPTAPPPKRAISGPAAVPVETPLTRPWSDASPVLSESEDEDGEEGEEYDGRSDGTVTPTIGNGGSMDSFRRRKR